ncbi:hypothetical protein B0I35DRAFT_111680 [Stachybotrys elegans]|uniref:Uncharacterized protein n=1 Tax=Stachybotrys elegans TaxID=80388 RepID=A0A8K0SEI4_9HYPO|nr:hypothetical protein B0I35DRAFT_111680 [Stachybotrys elegans]
MDEDCGLQGNGDLFGLGVRLGLYIQLLTSGMVSSLLPKSLHSSYFINTNISLFASTWIIIIKESILRDLPAVEINVFSVLALTQIGAIMVLVSRHLTMIPAISLAAIPAQILLSAYWTWFFWRGLDVLPRSACPDEYAFFFARVSLYHWFRTLSKVGYIILLVLVFYGCLTLPKQIRLIRELQTEAQGLQQEMEGDRWFQLVHIALQMVNTMLILAIAVTSTELTIKWNNIQGVYTLNSVGQLIPFITGLGLFMNVAYLIFNKYGIFHNHPEIEESLGDGSGTEPCPYRPGTENDQA